MMASVVWTEAFDRSLASTDAMWEIGEGQAVAVLALALVAAAEAWRIVAAPNSFPFATFLRLWWRLASIDEQRYLEEASSCCWPTLLS